MPTTFEDRERAFEAKFAHDEEFRFLVSARRDKLFARWAADRISLTEDNAQDLVAKILAIPDGPGHEERMLRQLEDAFSAHGAAVARTELTDALAACMRQALQQLTEKPPEQSDIL